MKIIRLFIFFFFAVIVICTILTFILPVHQKIERSIIINAPALTIYDQIIKLENFNKFSIWGQEDSSAIYSITGIDGTVGATSSWKGAPEISGEGKMEIILLEPNNKVVHDLTFENPKKGTAQSTFTLSEKDSAVTIVKWDFKIATPRPRNIFNLFYDMDKKMGRDFEIGLANLKAMIEISNAPKARIELP